jgi:hypothetical protein
MLNRSTLEKGLATMAHLTTAIAFGTAIYGLIFPQQAASYVSAFLDEIAQTRGSLERVDANTADTAVATQALASRMADRPRFDATSHRVSNGDHQFQMTLENLTDQPLTDLVVIIRTVKNGVTSSFLSHVVPPFETHVEATTGVAEMVCYAYGWNGEYVSETRTVSMNPTPMLDQMGNAGTYRFNHLDYKLRVESDTDLFTCGDQPYRRSDLAARKAQLESQKQP